jgi:carboxymethylenebutenolidase
VRVELPSHTPAEIALPVGVPRLGLVIAPDIMGLRPLFDDMAARLAVTHGWAVAAVEPFPGREKTSLPERRAHMGELDDECQLGDLIAAADYLGCARRAVIGFCMGGMYAFKAAGTGAFGAAVAFYGMIRVPSGWRGARNREPLDALQSPAACPTLALLGDRDPYTPAADIQALRMTPAEVVVYRHADHGFVHDPSRASHRATDATDAWRRMAAHVNALVG